MRLLRCVDVICMVKTRCFVCVTQRNKCRHLPLVPNNIVNQAANVPEATSQPRTSNEDGINCNSINAINSHAFHSRTFHSRTFHSRTFHSRTFPPYCHEETLRHGQEAGLEVSGKTIKRALQARDYKLPQTDIGEHDETLFSDQDSAISEASGATKTSGMSGASWTSWTSGTSGTSGINGNYKCCVW